MNQSLIFVRKNIPMIAGIISAVIIAWLFSVGSITWSVGFSFYFGALMAIWIVTLNGARITNLRFWFAIAILLIAVAISIATSTMDQLFFQIIFAIFLGWTVRNVLTMAPMRWITWKKFTDVLFLAFVMSFAGLCGTGELWSMGAVFLLSLAIWYHHATVYIQTILLPA